MLRLNSHRLIAVMVTIFFGWVQADARPARVDQIPNGRVIGCAACHLNPAGGGDLTPFGSDINSKYLMPRDRTGVVQWNAMLAMLDSDGDGVPNGRELGDPDGDFTVDASIRVTNPGVSPAVTSFVIGGMELRKDVKNLPVPSGMQLFEITFKSPVLPQTAEGIDIENSGFVLFPPKLFEALIDASDLAISEDRTRLTGTINLSEGAIYQMLIGPSEDVPIAQLQQYFWGTVELPDAVVSGVALLPEGFTPSGGPGRAMLIDPELYSKALNDGTNPLESTIVRISDINILESSPEQLEFELKHVPDGSYGLTLSLDVVDAQGTVVQDISHFVGINLLTGKVDPASIIQVEDGKSVTGLQIMMPSIDNGEGSTFLDVSVQSVNAETNSFIIQFNDQQIHVDASQALMVSLDPRNIDEIISKFISDNININDLASYTFSIADLMVGDTVSFIGSPISETEIQALIVIRNALSQGPSADLNSDGNVDFSDFLIFVDAFGKRKGEEGYKAAADLNSDGNVDFSDFLIFVDAFGKPVGQG